MNATATFSLDASDGRRGRGLSVGWGASLLVHAAIVAWLVHTAAPRPPDATPGQRIEVRLAPPTPPAPAPAVTAAPVAPARSSAATEAASPRARTHARSARATPTRAPAPAYATRPAPAHETPDTNPQPSVPAAAPAEARNDIRADTPAAPSVDMASARAAARRIAREEGKSLVALPARKTVVDPNADRQVIDPIEAARKRDCKSAYAGAGLLAIIPLAASAVMDTGCKW